MAEIDFAYRKWRRADGLRNGLRGGFGLGEPRLAQELLVQRLVAAPEEPH